MKYCSKCGTEAEDNAMFCSNCGNQFAAKQVNTGVAEAPISEPFSQPQFSGAGNIYENQSINYASEPTKKKLHRLGGPITLLVLSTIFFMEVFVGLALAPEDPESGAIVSGVCSVIALAFFIPGLICTIKFSIANKQVLQELKKQHCETTCNACHTNIQYSGTEPIPHRLWESGYLRCPKCGAIIGHSVYNIKYKDE